MLVLSSADFFFKINFFKKSFFGNTIRVSNYLDPDQDRRSVGPDLGTNCLQKLSTDDTKKRVNDLTHIKNISIIHNSTSQKITYIIINS